jgi:hypothetical protein
MSDPTDEAKQEPRLRGEAAWKQEKARIEARNVKAQKDGKERRATYERQREASRLGAEGKEEARFIASQPKE